MRLHTTAWQRTAAAVAGAMSIFALSLGAQAPAPQGRGGGAPQPAVRGGYTEAATLPVRIVDFKAEPASVKTGESVMLNWIVENPAGRGGDPVAITPGIGRVAPRGAMRVTPKATTTYTLTGNGNGGPVSRTITVTVAGTKPLAASEANTPIASRPAPRTADGKPDLTGVYGYGAGPGRGAAPQPAAGGIPRTPTLKPGAEKYRVVRGPDDTGLYSSCRPPGVPQTFMVPYYVQLIQSPKYVVIIHEYLSLPRIIEMDTQHPVDPDPFYMGHSVGRWEGDTLVVDSIGFKESEVSGYKTTEALHVIERFRRPNMGTLEYEAIIEDPNVFAQPWMLTRTFPLLPEHNRVDEFYCENNRDYRELFGKP